MRTEFISLFEALFETIDALDYYKPEKWEQTDALRRKMDMLVRKAFGDKSHYLDDMKKISFSPSIATNHSTASFYANAFNEGAKKVRNLVQVIIDELNLDLQMQSKSSHADVHSSSTISPNIFIVHGHDDLAKTEVARFIENLGFEPIILHEQASGGQTIIEKIEKHTNVGFGIILYTPCDEGGKLGQKDTFLPRARQNVLLEHGYLMGKLGRDKVCALVKGEVEKPSDISGIVYIDMDARKAWHKDVARELEAAGYQIDGRKLLRL